MNLASRVKGMPAIKPLYNMGCLMDIPNSSGSYTRGKLGEHYLIGGLAALEGVAARPNQHKSTFMHFRNLRLADRYDANGVVSDTEYSGTYSRYELLKKHHPRMKEVVFEDEANGYVVITDGRIYRTDDLWEELKVILKEKEKDKSNLVTLPMVTSSGKEQQILTPNFWGLDSLSRAQFKALDNIMDKNDVGAGGMNTMAAKDSGVKAQLIQQVSDWSLRSNLITQMTAHVDDKVELEMFPTNKQKLSFLNRNLAIKYVSNQYSFLMNNLWYIYSAKSYNTGTKDTDTAQYPRYADDPDNKDLMKMTLQNLRGKFGSSGGAQELMVSQRDGIIPFLSEYHYIRDKLDYYGLDGNKVTHSLSLEPGIKFTRKTVREKVEQHEELLRGFEITSELGQIQNVWTHIDPILKTVTPLNIYERLRELGYDVKYLLTMTRGFWTFNEKSDLFEEKFLSTWDLLMMCNDSYYPLWYDDTGLPGITNKDKCIKAMKEDCPWLK